MTNGTTPSSATAKRVVSLIASATEIVAALGHAHALVGRSHECDFPRDVERLPVLTAPRFEVSGTSEEIDGKVRALVDGGLSVYRVDEEALRALRPDVIVTQDHCDVCAVSLSDVEAAICAWTEAPARIVSLKPDSLADVYADIARVADALEAITAGKALIAAMKARFAAVAARVMSARRPRVAFIEWSKPLMAGGNWMPTLIEIAGGENLLGSAGRPSGVTTWDALREAAPEVIVVAPCGFTLAQTVSDVALLRAYPGWGDLTAVRAGEVYACDGNSYFNRPGPRLADSAEILAEILHPALVPPAHEGTAWRRLAS
ncbi:MAG: cobalamin-binding protein [Hyphomicrobiaceae bacterium]|nr:cobalamin-binding protein [Hyphomicrobiaceae bacterium]